MWYLSIVYYCTVFYINVQCGLLLHIVVYYCTLWYIMLQWVQLLYSASMIVQCGLLLYSVVYYWTVWFVAMSCPSLPCPWPSSWEVDIQNSHLTILYYTVYKTASSLFIRIYKHSILAEFQKEWSKGAYRIFSPVHCNPTKSELKLARMLLQCRVFPVWLNLKTAVLETGWD